MKNVIVDLDESTLEKVKKGVDTLANAVKITMGPSGKNVLIEVDNQHPILTKDGVTVASNINLRDRFENLGVQVVKEAAARTAQEAGDGTTTATLLAQTIFNKGLKMISSGYMSTEVKKGIDIGASQVIENLLSMSKEVSTKDQIHNVAFISANGEEKIAKLITSAIDRVGKDGIVTVQDAKGFNSSLTLTNGYQYDKGYTSPYFINDEDRSVCIFEDPYVLILNKRVSELSPVTKILELCLRKTKSLLIISDEIEGEAMQALIVNKMKGVLDVCVVSTVGRGRAKHDLLSDISLMLDSKIIEEEDSFEDFDESWLGTCGKCEIRQDRTIFTKYQNKEEKTKLRIKNLTNQIEDLEKEKNEIDFIKHRISRLTGQVAILRVGGSTEAEVRERCDRVDDALSATKCAIVSGILPGGGISLMRAADRVSIPEDEFHTAIGAGVSIVKESCYEPIRQIVKNVGRSPDVIIEKLKDQDNLLGYDAREDVIGDMYDLGIIDPTSVTVSAIKNAASASGMLLTVGCVLVVDDGA